MLNFIALGLGVLPAHRPAPGQRAEGASIVTTTPMPESGWFPGLNGLFDRAGPGRAAHRALRLPDRRDRRRRPHRGPAQAHPVRLRPAGHRALAVGRHRQRRRRPRHGGQDDAALRRRRRADRPAGPARRHPQLRHRVHRRPGLPRHRGGAARPQQPRSASPSPRCCSPSSTGPRCRCSSPTSRRRWSRSSRARSCSPSSSPTRSPAGWRCARPSGRRRGRRRRPATADGGGGAPAAARTAGTHGTGPRRAAGSAGMSTARPLPAPGAPSRGPLTDLLTGGGRVAAGCSGSPSACSCCSPPSG